MAPSLLHRRSIVTPSRRVGLGAHVCSIVRARHAQWPRLLLLGSRMRLLPGHPQADIFLAAHRSRLSRSGVWLAGRAIRLAAAEPTIASRPRARGGVVGGPRSRRSRPLVSRFLLPAAQRHVALGQQAVPGKEGLVEPGMSRTGQKVVGEFCNVFRRSRSRRRVWAVRFCGPYCGPA